ncbi:MAG: NFACT family protein, partial [Candidatus Micrarchaeia archaeon]
LRKRLNNAVVEEICQVSLDRLVRFRLRKEETHLLYFEMFAKGNVVLCDENNKVVAAYHEQKEGKRVVARNGQYPIPPEAADPFDSKATEKIFEAIKEGAAEGKEVAKEAATKTSAATAKSDVPANATVKDAAKKIALSPTYFEDFAKAVEFNEAKKASKTLEKYVSAEKYTAYYDETGAAIGFSAVKLNEPAKFLKATPASEKTFEKFSDCLDEYYSKAALGPVKKSKNAKLEKLLRQKELQEKSIADALGAADKLQALGDAIYLHFDEAETAIDKAKKEKKNKTEIEIED